MSCCLVTRECIFLRYMLAAGRCVTIVSQKSSKLTRVFTETIKKSDAKMDKQNTHNPLFSHSHSLSLSFTSFLDFVLLSFPFPLSSRISSLLCVCA